MVNEIEQCQPQSHSQLFTVRLWRDTGQTSEAVPYMQVKHVLSGETRYFSDWPPLVAYLLSKLDLPLGTGSPAQP